jgi:Uncharacterized protein conserved in bacteria
MSYMNPQLDPQLIHAISTLGLAHIGDGVYELLVRSKLCLEGKATNKSLHKATVELVKASAQAAGVPHILPMLTEEEQDVFRRGRNVSPHAVPQNATRSEYQQATAVEALFGYLYLKGESERVEALFAKMMEE